MKPTIRSRLSSISPIPCKPGTLPLFGCQIPRRGVCWTGEVMDVYDMDKAAFGAFVAGLRKEKGWTQRELAEQLHITDKAVSKWETGGSLR